MDNKEFLSKIQDIGYITINEDKHPIETNDKYYQLSANDHHPNENAWNEIAPFLVKN
jgi:hypothetical protein